MNGNRPPPPGPDPRARREPSQVIRRDPNYRPAWPPNPPTPPRRPPPPPRPPRQQQPPPRPQQPPTRPPAPPKAKKPRRKRRWGRILLACLLVFVVAVVATGVWMDSSLHRIPALADYPERPAAGKGTTWLLVGSDSRQHLTPDQQAELATGGDIGDGRTDTILLVHVPALRVEHADHDGVHSAGLVRADSRLRRATRSTRRSPSAAPRCWRRPSNRPPACGSTTTPRSGSTDSPSWSMPSAE